MKHPIFSPTCFWITTGFTEGGTKCKMYKMQLYNSIQLPQNIFSIFFSSCSHFLSYIQWITIINQLCNRLKTLVFVSFSCNYLINPKSWWAQYITFSMLISEWVSIASENDTFILVSKKCSRPLGSNWHSKLPCKSIMFVFYFIIFLAKAILTQVIIYYW